MEFSKLGEIAWYHTENYWFMLESTEQQRMFKDIEFFKFLINIRKLSFVEDVNLIAFRVAIDKLFSGISHAKVNINLIFCCALYETEKEVLDNLMNLIDYGFQPDMVLPGDGEEGFNNLSHNMRSCLTWIGMIIMFIAQMIIEDNQNLDDVMRADIFFSLTKFIELWIKEDLSLL